jgi:hypothetical protein
MYWRKNKTSMRFSDQILIRKLAIVMVFKLAILLALWWVFVRDAHVPVDGRSVAAQLLQPATLTVKGSKK